MKHLELSEKTNERYFWLNKEEDNILFTLTENENGMYDLYVRKVKSKEKWDQVERVYFSGYNYPLTKKNKLNTANLFNVLEELVKPLKVRTIRVIRNKTSVLRELKYLNEYTNRVVERNIKLEKQIDKLKKRYH